MIAEGWIEGTPSIDANWTSKATQVPKVTIDMVRCQTSWLPLRPHLTWPTHELPFDQDLTTHLSGSGYHDLELRLLWFDGEDDEDDGEDGEDDDGEDGEDDGEDELDDVNRFDARLPVVISCCVLIW